MKKKFFVLLALLCVIFLNSCAKDYYNDFSVDANRDNFEITAGKELIKYNGNSNFVKVPDDVLVIREGAFANIDTLYTIIIPEGVQRIDDNAFSDCHHLVEVYNYSKLKIEAQSEGNGNIAINVLKVHTELEQTALTNTSGGFISLMTDDNDYLIDYVGESNNFIVPVRFNIIYRYAFYEKELKSVSLSSQITEIGSYAFYGCKHLYNIGLSSMLRTIGAYAFYDCKSLVEITLPKTLVQIDEYAFYGCDKLISITNLSNLNVKVSDVSFGYIGYNALNVDKKYLNTLNIKNNKGFITYELDGEVILIDYRGGQNIITIPDEVTIIQDNAFEFNDRFVSITLSKNIKEIGSSLDNLKNLVEIYNLSELDQERFSNISYYDYYESLDDKSRIEKTLDTIVYKHLNGDVELLLVTSNTGTYDLIIDISYINKYAFYESDITTIIIGNKKLTQLDKEVLDNSTIENIFYNGYELEFKNIFDEEYEGINIYYYSDYFLEGSWHYVGTQIEIWTKDNSSVEQSSLSK